MNNLFISYDLIAPGQHYEEVIQAIKQLGDWAKVHYSLYYVKSDMSCEAAANHVRTVMDSNDTLFVIDASQNLAAYFNLHPDAHEQMTALWS